MFGSKQSLILAILSENPQKEYYLHELGRLIGKKPGVFQIGINSLEKQGWILSRKQGTLRLFKINEQHPLYNEIKSFVRKTVGIEAQLKKILNSIQGIEKALIYGSYVKDSMRLDSDVDVLVVVSNNKAEDMLVTELSQLEKTIGREVNYKLYNEKDFSQRWKAKDPFLAEVLSDKYLLLKGTI
jgi:predicted nucleotidyltransferase